MLKFIHNSLFRMMMAAIFLSAFSAAAQPSNDDPCGAIVVSVNTDGWYCPNPGAHSTQGATNTASTLVPAPMCSSGNGDVWFKFTATATSHRITRSHVLAIGGGFVNPGMAVYSSVGGSCNALTEMNCNAAGAITNVTGLIVGDVYFIRVWTAGGAGAGFTFSLCVGAPPAVPLNDDCVNAIAIDNGTLYSAHTDNATQSKPAEDCTGWGLSTQALDVWYKFTASATGSVTVTATEYEGQPYTNLERFESCGGLASVDCDDNAGTKFLVVPVTAGATYYFRQYASDAVGSSLGGYMSIQASGTPLPVSISNFEVAAADAGRVHLDWTCLSDKELKGFYIERSTDGKNFDQIDFVAAATIRNHPSEYRFTDIPVMSGMVYYRLKKLDAEGHSQFSEVKSIQLRPGRKVSVYPNPARHFVVVAVSEGYASGEITITDLAGRVVQWMPTTLPKTNVVIEGFPAGTYLIRYSRNGEVLHREKFVVR